MKNWKWIAGLLAATMVWTAPVYEAQADNGDEEAVEDVPYAMTHQGRLIDDEGAPVTGEVELTYTIYDAATEGDILWSDVLNVTVDETGFYSVTLGGEDNPIDPVILVDGKGWMGVAVNQEAEMEPRIALNSVPFALRAQSAQTADFAYDSGVAEYADEAGMTDYASEAGSAETADTAGEADYATEAGSAETADTAESAETADYASEAGTAESADTADEADYASEAGFAAEADTADYADEAGFATTADTASSADTADFADEASFASEAGTAQSADTADYADEAGFATTADTASSADTADFADEAGFASEAGTAQSADTAGYADEAGFATTADTASSADFADEANVCMEADVAMSLDTSASIDIDGDIATSSDLDVGGDASFDGEVIAKVTNGAVYAGHPDFGGDLQDAIDFADTHGFERVDVPSGTYDPIVVPEDLTVASVNGTANHGSDTIIEGTQFGGASPYGTTVELGDRATIKGFVIRSGPDNIDTGVYADNHARVIGNRFEDHIEGVLIDGSRNIVSENNFSETLDVNAWLRSSSNRNVITGNSATDNSYNNSGDDNVIEANSGT